MLRNDHRVGTRRRLLGWGVAARAHLVASVLIGTARAVLLVAQAWLLATIIAGVAVGGRGLEAVRAQMLLLLAVVALRAVTAWSSDVVADRCSSRVKSSLRTALLQRAAVLGGDGRQVARPSDVATLALHGVDGLDGYFGRYVPQMLLAVVVPVTVVLAVLAVDWLSAVILVVTLPLVPLFMALIGIETRRHTDRQLHELQALSGHFLDVVGGLTTLKVFGRSSHQLATIASVTDRYRRRVMTTLRLAFTSSLALELVASVSVAVIAVAVGLRLLGGHIGLRASLFVLVLAPEAYLPLRQLGADYHASAEGVSAADQVFSVVDNPLPARGRGLRVPDPATSEVVVDRVWFTYPGRDQPALCGAELVVRPGELLAVTGPSGCGKSTLLSVLLGLVVPDDGAVRVAGVDLADVDPGLWRQQVAWVPQRPHLFAASIADNVRLGRPGANDADVLRALADAGMTDVVARLPCGPGTVLGERGAGLSAGERQRVALARAFLRDAQLLLLDEPTASLDGETEAAIVDAVRRLSCGRTTVLVAHRPALAGLADRVVSVSRAGVAA
jgi:ATP-binding cassette subfamily C protein CydD